ncbi:MAG: ribonuclease HII [Bacteroidetes bacterium]|nr:ribonuclease HII [Bacteroidota bacterium]
MLDGNFSKIKPEAGCDEAGRGCLAGPVTAAAVILPDDFHHPLLNDSKQVGEKQRNQLRLEIEKAALAWAVAFVDNAMIDEINILNAAILAMHKAIEKLTIRPAYLIIDGNRFKPFQDIPHACIIKGDGKYKAIAAASILAKTHRDEYMQKIHNQYPVYNWQANKGYPTREHRLALSEHGVCQWHRKSFRLYEQLKFSFE